MKKICIIADTHRKHREIEIPECDLLIHCGDMCSFEQEELATLQDVDAWFSESLAKQVVYIGGNHDYLLQSGEFVFQNAHYLEDRMVELAGLKIYGAPWCPDLMGFAFYQDDTDIVERWKSVPEGVDILVTHTPPYGVLDTPSSGSPHLGCAHLKQELERISPRYHVFGHIHASHAREMIGGTE